MSRYSPTWFVYRLVDERDATIYVGMTKIFPTRMSAHYTSPEYGHRIASVLTERYLDVDEAASRELELIRELSPELNKLGIVVVDEDPTIRSECSAGCGRQVSHRNAKVCQPCVDVAYQEFVAGGPTMSDIARRLDVSRERVRQLFNEIVGGSGLAIKLRKAILHERAALIAECEAQAILVKAEIDEVTCATCGRRHARRNGSSWRSSCSPECSEMWQAVRLLHEDHHEAHRKAVAAWQVRNRDSVHESTFQSSVRVLEGTMKYDGAWVNRPRRYLIEGSYLFEVVQRALREDWPAFSTWPEDIQRQAREFATSDAA